MLRKQMEFRNDGRPVTNLRWWRARKKWRIDFQRWGERTIQKARQARGWNWHRIGAWTVFLLGIAEITYLGVVSTSFMATQTCLGLLAIALFVWCYLSLLYFPDAATREDEEHERHRPPRPPAA